MRHSQLKAFHYVALLEGFSRAAEALYLTQPAISEQIKKLEQENDVLLFERKKRRVILTPAGEELLLLTKRYFEVEEQIGQYLSEKGAAVEGELRIVADAAQHVTDILAKYRDKYPGVTISLRTGNSLEIIEELRAYNAEIGVVGSVPSSREMTALDIGSSPIIAFAALGILPAGTKGMTIEELAKYPLVFREEGSKTRQQVVEAAAKLGVRLNPVVVAEGREAVRAVVLSGAGIGFVSEAEYSHDDRLQHINITDLDIRMSEAVIHLALRSDVRLIRSFMEFARQTVEK